MIKINQIPGLNRQARKFLLENCISVRNYPVTGWGFTGYINSNWFDNIRIERTTKGWIVCSTEEPILGIKGELEFFTVK